MNRIKQEIEAEVEVEEEEELHGNIVVIAIGCKQCPSNQEYRISKREESDAAAEAVGKVIECPRCHGNWILKRVQVRGSILDADHVTEEWRVAPLFIPILTSFGMNRFNIIDVPVSMIEEEKED